MKILLTIFLLMYSAHSLAEGPYDGIWYVHPYGYSNLSEKDGVVVVLNAYTSDMGGSWEAYQGFRTGNKIRVKTIEGTVKAVIDIVMTSYTTFNATQVSCIPLSIDNFCSFPNGVLLQGVKVW